MYAKVTKFYTHLYFMQICFEFRLFLPFAFESSYIFELISLILLTESCLHINAFIHYKQIY